MSEQGAIPDYLYRRYLYTLVGASLALGSIAVVAIGGMAWCAWHQQWQTATVMGVASVVLVTLESMFHQHVLAELRAARTALNGK